MKAYVKIFFLLLSVTLAVLATSTNSIEQIRNRSNGRIEKIMQSDSLQLEWAKALDFQTYHVQGLEVVANYFFVTSVDKKTKRGWLLRIDRKSMQLDSSLELTDGARFHPGGMQYDGHQLWIPLAEYRRKSSTKILCVDPITLRVTPIFNVNDHIGAIATDFGNRLFGANWNAEEFYVWDYAGKKLQVVNTPTHFAYQDIKFKDGFLFCNGYRADTAAVDLITTDGWELKKRVILPSNGWTGNMSREGMAVEDGKFYFLPDDGPDSKIYRFTVY